MRKSDYLQLVEEGYQTYCDTKKMSKYEAARKFLDLLILWSEQEYDEENDIYFRRMKKKTTINLNGISSFEFDEFRTNVFNPEDEWDDEWSISISFYEKNIVGHTQSNYISFKGCAYEELSIDGFIYNDIINSRLGGEIFLLTSVKL